MPQIPRMNTSHAQRSAAPPPPPTPEMDQVQGYLHTGRSEIDDDTSLIRSEADKIAQRLLKTEQELERLKKQGDLIGESLRKQKALDIEAPTRTVQDAAMPPVEEHCEVHVRLWEHENL